MGLTIESSGTTTPTPLGTETQLAAPSTSATRVLRLDMANLTTNATANEILTIRIKTAVLAAGAVRDQHYCVFTGPVGTALFESIPISSDVGATFTITQTGGTARAYPWKILTLGNVPLGVESSNTLTPTIGTPSMVANPSTNKTRVLRVDLGNLVSGDTVSLRIQEAVLAAGTIRDHFYEFFANAQGCPIIESVPISSDVGATFTITQTVGTVAKQIPWKVLTID